MNDLVTIDSYCQLEKTSLRFKREVSKDEWMHVFKSLKMVEGCVQFWLGDCLAYRQQKWGMYDDVAEEVGIDKGTLSNLKAVAERVEKPLRNGNLSFSHHQQVAYLPSDKQETFLKKAVDEKLSVRELRNEIKKDNRPINENLPKGKYQVIYADPAWQYNDTCENGAIQSRGVDDVYLQTMSIEEICALSVNDLSDINSVLFIWVTSPFLEEVFTVINAWGFKYKTSFVWDKIKHNMGHYNSVRHEFLLIATKGSCTPDNLKLFDSVQSIEKTEHSKKPEEFYNIIETLYSGKKIELFARNKRDGWDYWGNEK
jgi:N6-adenosine-specific RNA methylase IME4